MTISWPVSLSGKLLAVSGYSEDVAVDPTIRTTMDSGPPKMRPRFTAVPITITGMIDTLSSADVDALLSFYKTDCIWGSQSFTWTHPRTGVTATFMWTKYPKIEPANSPVVFTASINLLQMPT